MIKKKLSKAFPSFLPGDKNLQDLRALIAPINIRKSHWLLLAVDFDKRAFVVIDSMGCSLQRANEYQKTLCSVLDPYFYQLKIKPSFWPLSINSNTPQQRNMSDCGLSACLNTLDLSRSAVSPSSKNFCFTYSYDGSFSSLVR